MSEVNLYIAGQKCDMFEGESIKLTRQITDYQDPDKVFSNFTKSFTLPATGVNNRIFQHYYNVDVDGTFDPFSKVKAYLESNSLTIDDGIIELISVNTKKHRPVSYSLVFYGLITGLKTLFKDDTLNVLDISGLNHVVNYSNITDSWDLNLLSGNVVYPMFDFERPWIYSSTVNDSRNIASINSGILAIEMKPAVRLKYIWDTIFNHYNITYTSDLINASSTFNGLYMLMHREGGDLNDVVNANDNYSSVKLSTSTISGTGNFQLDFTTINSDVNGNIDLVNDTFTSPLVGPYTFSVERFGISYTGTFPKLAYSVNGGTLNIVTNTFINPGITSFGVNLLIGDSIEVFVIIDGSITITGGVFYTAGFPKYAYGNNLTMNNLWPENFKVRDFMDGILKMFDLIIVPNGIDNFRIENRQEYYQNGERKKWDKYIDTENVVYSKIPILKDISFEHKEGKDMPQQILNSILGRKYGSASFQPDLLFTNNSLSIETPFSPSLLVEMVDQNASGVVVANTGIFINRMLDNDGKPVVDSPRIFYYDDSLQNPCLPYYLQNGTGTGGNPTFISTAKAPFCSMFTDIVCDADTESFNFSIETPYAGVPPIKTLFQEYYSDYIQRLYDLQSRVLKLSAILPLSEYIKIELSDNIEFDGNYYVINKITYNLSTNEADMELISFFKERTYPRATGAGTGGGVGIGGGNGTSLIARKENLYNITSDNYWRTFAFQTAMEKIQKGQPTLLPMDGYYDSNSLPDPE